MSNQERVPLDEAAIEFLEAQIPSQAEAATQAAYWRTLTQGHKVVTALGDELCEISPDGTKRVLKKLEPNVRLPEGIEIVL